MHPFAQDLMIQAYLMNKLPPAHGKRCLVSNAVADLLMYGNPWTVLELPELLRPLVNQLALLIDHVPDYSDVMWMSPGMIGDLRSSFESMSVLWHTLRGYDEHGRPVSETVAVPSDDTPVVSRHRYRTL